MRATDRYLCIVSGVTRQLKKECLSLNQIILAFYTQAAFSEERKKLEDKVFAI